MRSKISLYVLTFVAVVFTTACDRYASSKTSITLQMPRELQAQNKSALNALEVETLQHLVLQISGPGMDSIQIIRDSEGGSSINSEFALEVPPGDNRIIQLIAAYGRHNDDNPTVYYGDVVTDLRAGTYPIVVDVKKLGGGSVSIMTRVSGRYLTANTDGPSGELRMIYKPVGKPAMPIDKSKMIGGWFEVSVFDNIPVDYVLDSGLVIGSNWTASSFAAPQPHFIKVITPDSYRRYQQDFVIKYDPYQARDEVYGFFAADTNFLADKKICVSVNTQKNGTIHSWNALSAQNIVTARPYRHFDFNQSFSPSAQHVTVSGGLTLSNCGTFLPSEEFSKILLFQPPFDSNHGYDNQFILGFEELIAKPMGKFDAISGMQTRSHGPVMSYSLALGFHASISLLPGTESQVERVILYPYVSNLGSFSDDRCDRVNKNGWTLLKDLPARISGNKVIVAAADLPSGVQHVKACLKNNNGLIGRVQDIQFDHITPANEMQIVRQGTLVTNSCIPMELQMKSSGIDGKSTSAMPFSISANDSALFERSDCADTPQSLLNITVPPGAGNAKFYMNLYSPGDVTLTTTSGPGGVTLPSPVTFTFPAPAGSANSMVVVDAYKSGINPLPYTDKPLQLYASGCFEFGLAAMYNINTPALATSGITLSVRDLGGTVTSSGLSFYTDCNSSTPISTLTYSGDHLKSFAVKTSASPTADLQVVASGGAFSASLPFNVINQATRITAVTTTTPITYQCYPMTLTARDSANNLKTASAKTYVDLKSTGANPEEVLYYSDNVCSMPITKTFIPAGSATTGLYMMTTKQQSVDITTHSIQAPSSSNFTVTSTASALTTQNITAMQFNTAMTVTITGGSAPYTLSTTTPGFWSSTISGDATFNSGVGRYTFNVFSSDVPGNANIRITDGALNVLNLTISIAP